MAGGLGSRLYPVTLAINKHLIPVHKKPLIFYPLSTLMLAGIRDFLIISNEEDLPAFKKLLGDGSRFGVSISFSHQTRPGGISEGLLIARDFVKDHKIGMILGDNIFHGVGLGRHLRRFTNLIGAHCFAYRVNNPSAYGILNLDANLKISSIEEKPSETQSDLAIPGLYFLDERAVKFAMKLSPSSRGELEITDLLKEYLSRSELNYSLLPSGTFWIDAGTFESLEEATMFVRAVEGRQAISIGNPIEIARINQWIKSEV